MMMPIPIHGSVDDAHTILLGVEEPFSPPDFKEYLLKEQVNWSRFQGVLPDWFGWVFWSQLDNFAGLIRNALQKLIFKKELSRHLIQFWAATKTSEGRTLLTTQFQPFALGTTSFPYRLCEYRMGMCREYNNSFYADAECAQELLGLPGRVFLNQLPESTPNVELYTLKEYPQLDLALDCEIASSSALPVFDHSGHTCVGVLEIVSPYGIDLHDKEFLGSAYDIFQIYWSVHPTHRNAEFFPEPLKFDPSRFEGFEPAPYTFVPFGGGPRMCPGKEYARLEILVFMHHLVRR